MNRLLTLRILPITLTIFVSNIGTNLSSSIKLDEGIGAFTDYLHNPTDHRFTFFSQINEREVLSIIN